MAPKPDFTIDLHTQFADFSTPVRTTTSSPDSFTPQAGFVPPALSPLDAFALQGRILAKQLEDQQKSGRPISRLPAFIASELAKPRPSYFGDQPSPSTPEKKQSSADKTESGTKHTVTPPSFRPKSQYPTFCTSGAEKPEITTHLVEASRSPITLLPRHRPQDKTLDLVTTPEEQLSTLKCIKDEGTPTRSSKSRVDSAQGTTASLRPKLPNEHSFDSSLREPMTSDNRYLGPIDRIYPIRTVSPGLRPPVLPSDSSERSPSRDAGFRKSVNFSRPINAVPDGSTENKLFKRDFLEHTHDAVNHYRSRRAVSNALQADAQYLLESSVPRPPWSSVVSDTLSVEDIDSLALDSTPSSYVYSTFSLRRGKSLGRLSSSQCVDRSHGVQPPNSTTSPTELDAFLGPFKDSSAHSVPSMLMVPAQHHSRTRSADASTLPTKSGCSHHRLHPSIPSPTATSAPFLPLPTTSLVRSAPNTPPVKHLFPKSPLLSESPLMVGSEQSTPEAHLATGIACHEEGRLQKSTYHLRIAARAGLPTAMLLYALACRHGWGMRPSQAEGVQWLKKALDCTNLEVADDEAAPVHTPLSEPRKVSAGSNSAIERKTHRAQLALCIYELGMSYLNGWGISQDKSLALRCFEIAGSWGDADALAEAGYCYAKGVGCKKDMKRAAALYRKAEAVGISMSGNSWIYKDKYMPAEEKLVDERTPRAFVQRNELQKKPKDETRTRTMFGGRKKSVAGS